MPEIIIKLGDNIVHRYFFDKDVMSIGRARDNDIVIENLSVSRNHARIRRIDGKYILTDLNSANGTFVNGVQITKTEVVDNDIVSIGKHKLHFMNKPLTDEQVISDAFGADRTMIVDKTPTACLIVTKGRQKDQEFKLTKYETPIGRSAENDIRLHDWFVSKKHAVLIRQGQKFFVKDLGSWRGLKLNGKQIKESELKEGDELELGTTTLVFRLTEEGAPIKITGRVPKEIGVEEVQTPPEVKKVTDTEIKRVMTGYEYEEEKYKDVETPISKEKEEEIVEEEKAEEEEIVGQKVVEAEGKELEELQVGFEKMMDEEEEKAKEEVAFTLSEEVEITEDLAKEIALWEKALKNKSIVIRKQAARMLKKLTGKDYSYE